MENPSSSNILVLLMAAMLAWLSIRVLLAVIRLNRSFELGASRIILPANCKPEQCQDLLGFIHFMTPRLWAFALLGLGLSVFMVLNEMAGLLSGLPSWFADGAALFLFVPLFIWYVIFINKAAKRFW